MTNTTQSPTYRLVSEKSGRDAMEYLREKREAGVSWRNISLGLYADHQLSITEVTLRKWWADAHLAEAEGEEASDSDDPDPDSESLARRALARAAAK